MFKIGSTARKRTSTFLIALSISVVHHLLLCARLPFLLCFWPREPSVLFSTIPWFQQIDSKCITPLSALVHSDKQKLVWGHLHSTRSCSPECARERVGSWAVTCCAISSSSEMYLLETASPLRSVTAFCGSFYREETCGYALQVDQDEKMLHCNLVARPEVLGKGGRQGSALHLASLIAGLCSFLLSRGRQLVHFSTPCF